MVEITYDREHYSLTAKGHAQGGEKGQDPVCAGVSALVITLAENVASLVTQGNAQRQELRLCEGDAQIRCTPKDTMQAVVRLVYDVVCSGFALMQTLYPENVRYRVLG